MFTKNKYMLGDDFSMLDVAIAPLLWRLDHYGIKLARPPRRCMKYAERIFSRPAFIEALTPSEKVMRKVSWRRLSMAESRPSRTCCARCSSGASTTATRRTSR